MAVKRYLLNKDFAIDCETIERNGIKQYGVYVVQVGLPFLNVLEGLSGITDSSIANDLFKKYTEKYRNPIGF